MDGSRFGGGRRGELPAAPEVRRRSAPNPERNPVQGLDLDGSHVQEAHDYLQATLPWVEQAKYELKDAQYAVKVAYAEIWKITPGRTEKDRDCAVICHPKYAEAMRRLARAEALLARHDATVEAHKVTVSAWQSMMRTANAVKI